MIHFERSVPVNPEGTTRAPTRSELWQGLVKKGNDPGAFIPSMTSCEVIERESATSFVREIELGGERMKERVILEPETKMTFERLSGSVLGRIENWIDEDDRGLHLRFTFDLEIPGATPSEEKAWAARMEPGHIGAVDSTLATIRKLHGGP